MSAGVYMKAFLLLLCGALSMLAADATGNWTGTLTVTTTGGPGPTPAFLVLKQDGDKLTGTAGGSKDRMREIEKGKVEGGSITFEISVEGGVMKFDLKLAGDEIKGNVNGDRGDEKMQATLEVKRDK